jgi:hypothetical protein
MLFLAHELELKFRDILHVYPLLIALLILNSTLSAAKKTVLIPRLFTLGSENNIYSFIIYRKGLKDQGGRGMDYKYYSRRKRDWGQSETERRRIEQQRLKYNLLGMLVMAIILFLALDLFDLGERITRFFTGN